MQEFLERQARTSEIMNLFDFEEGELDEAERRVIVNTIADGLLDRHQIVSQEMRNDIANDLCLIFKKEASSVYFQYGRKLNETCSVSGNVSRSPRGKIHDRLVNESHRREKLGKKLKDQASSSSEFTPEDKAAVQAKGFLRYQTEPIDTVKIMWETSFKLREAEASQDTSCAIFLE